MANLLGGKLWRMHFEYMYIYLLTIFYLFYLYISSHQIFFINLFLPGIYANILSRARDLKYTRQIC